MNTGYIFQHNGHAYTPNGGVEREMTPEQVLAHNRAVEQAELKAMRETGRAVLYLFKDAAGKYSVGTWCSEPYRRAPVKRVSVSRHNLGIWRTDVWFYADGSTWHGVNIGDNDIVRCSRNKDKVKHVVIADSAMFEEK